MAGCYLKSLPRKFMRTMAGHPPHMGCFEIRRAAITPPEALLSMVWPGLERWKDRFGPGDDQINDLAAMGLTNLLFYLREVILQVRLFLCRSSRATRCGITRSSSTKRGRHLHSRSRPVYKRRNDRTSQLY